MYKIKGVGAHIKVKNFQKSLEFYQNLGLQKVFEYGPNKHIREDYSGAVFDTGSGKIEIANGHRAVKPEVFEQTIGSSKISLMISVASLSGVISRTRRAGIKLAVEPRHYYWGTLEAVIKDPDGVVLVFIAPYSESEAQRLHADESFSIKP